MNSETKSPQPSPAGQDERAALIEEAIGYLDLIDVQPPLVDQARRVLARALAARQPVAATGKDSLTVGGGQAVGQEPVTVEAVATVRRGSNGDRYIDWLTEGGIADLEVGDVLMVSDRAVTDEDGSGEVYTAPPAQAVDLGQFRRVIAAHRDSLTHSPRETAECDRLLALIDIKAVGNG